MEINDVLVHKFFRVSCSSCVCFSEKTQDSSHSSHGSPWHINVLVDDAIIWFGDGECFVRKYVLIEESFARLVWPFA